MNTSIIIGVLLILLGVLHFNTDGITASDLAILAGIILTAIGRVELKLEGGAR